MAVAPHHLLCAPSMAVTKNSLHLLGTHPVVRDGDRNLRKQVACIPLFATLVSEATRGTGCIPSRNFFRTLATQLYYYGEYNLDGQSVRL